MNYQKTHLQTLPTTWHFLNNLPNEYMIFLRSKVLLTPAAQGSILKVPRIFLLMLLRFIDGTAENSGQRLEHVNLTHLGLAGGKLVLQK